MAAQLLEERVIAAKNDKEDLDKLIGEYLSFIYKAISETAGIYDKENYSTTAMLAFTEAVHSFCINKGKFLVFAYHVIKRRVTDQYRKEMRQSIKVIPSDESDFNELTNYDETIGYNIELQMLTEELKQFNITFEELYLKHPKHKETRKRCIEAGRMISQNKRVMSALLEKKKLHIKEASKLTGLSQKVIQRSKIYIIAVALIYQEKYGYLRDFIKE